MKFKTFLTFGIIFLFSGAFVFAALDLAFVTAITQSPDPATAGATVNFTIGFRTDGGAVTNMRIIGGVDGTQILNRTYASIAADTTRTDAFTWTATAGSHTVWFELDPDHAQGDSDYTNNRIEKAITVSGGAQPDLTVKATYAAANFKEDDPISFSVTVNNIGNATSSTCKLVLLHSTSNMAYASQDVPAINAGGNWTTSQAWNVDCSTPLKFTVDAFDTNAESNESNNTWSKTMKCGLTIQNSNAGISQQILKQDPNGPDLTIRISETGHDDDEIFFHIAVENKGVANSVKCTLMLKKGNIEHGTYAINALQIGEKQEIWIAWPKMTAAKLTFIADSDNKNIEINENNNSVVKNYRPENPRGKKMP
jgi:hypothetical protein